MTWPCAQGHALLTRQMGSSLPCPAIDFTGGFNKFYAAAFGLAHTSTAIKEKYGVEFDPFLNDETFVTSVLALEELGATGNKVSLCSCIVLALHARINKSMRFRHVSWGSKATGMHVV